MALVAATGCGPSSSNSAASDGNQNDTVEVAVSAHNAQNVAEPIVPKMPPAPNLSTIEGRTEAAMMDQLSCRRPPRAAQAINAMLNTKLLRKSDDFGDGYFIYVPAKPLFVLGLPVVRVAGWQSSRSSGMKSVPDGMPPFTRVRHGVPANFFEVTVRGTPAQVRSAITALGIREESWGPNPNDGRDWVEDPGIVIQEGDMGDVASKLTGVTTLSCMPFRQS